MVKKLIRLENVLRTQHLLGELVVSIATSEHMLREANVCLALEPNFLEFGYNKVPQQVTE